MIKYLDYRTYPDNIPSEKIFEITTEMLKNLYADGDEATKYNVLLILINNYYNFKEMNLANELAYLCYIISYYIFVLLTPPNSDSLALVYAKKACVYSNQASYKEWKEYVLKGN